jgi:pterin-4a-carbinolamine dehydratase
MLEVISPSQLQEYTACQEDHLGDTGDVKWHFTTDNFFLYSTQFINQLSENCHILLLHPALIMIYKNKVLRICGHNMGVDTGDNYVMKSVFNKLSNQRRFCNKSVGSKKS